MVIFAPLASASELEGKPPQLTPLPEPLASFGAATLDGYLYVYGGHVGERHDHSRDYVRGTFRRQTLAEGKWEELPGGPALQSPALVAHDGKLYRIGGMSARNSKDEIPDLHSVASVDCYDPHAKKWSPVADLPLPRSSHDAVVVGNRIYVGGGWNHHGEEGEADWHDTLLVLDLAQQKPEWTTVARTPFQRRALSIAALDGKLYVIGGLTSEVDFSQNVDIYDIAADQWVRGPDLPESDYNGFGSSAFTVHGVLYASSMSDQLLALSASGDGWEQAARLSEPRFFHRLIPGPSGTVLLIAGANDDAGHLASIACIRVTTK